MKKSTKKPTRKSNSLYEPDKVMLMVAIISALSLVLLAAFGL